MIRPIIGTYKLILEHTVVRNDEGGQLVEIVPDGVEDLLADGRSLASNGEQVCDELGSESVGR